MFHMHTSMRMSYIYVRMYWHPGSCIGILGQLYGYIPIIWVYTDSYCSRAQFPPGNPILYNLLYFLLMFSKNNALFLSRLRRLKIFLFFRIGKHDYLYPNRRKYIEFPSMRSNYGNVSVKIRIFKSTGIWASTQFIILTD
jgi:hypothetical protein